MVGFSMDAALKFRATASRLASPRESLRERYFRKMFETAPIGLAICGLDGHVVEANTMLGALLGYELKEMGGIDLWQESRGQESRGQENREQESQGTEKQGKENGESADEALPRVTELPAPHSLEGLLRGERETFTAERRWQRRDGSEFLGRLTATVARNDQGQPEALMVVLEDVSKRREMEERVQQAEKMEVIGRLSGGVAHDFNNLLTGILLYSDLLLADLEPASLPHRYVHEVQLACEHGAALTRQLLTMARKSGPVSLAAGINEVIAVTENLLRRLIGGQIEMTTALDPAADALMADAGGLRQVLLNLVLNARDALGRGNVAGGKIRISTRISEAGGCVLTVEDNGCGMSAETRSHLFEPFFTTKKEGEGTGLGLGTVQRIVSELGGKIEVASAAGSGTRVQVFLPALERESGKPCSSQADATLRDGTNAQSPIATQVLKFSGDFHPE